ncbi:MAG: type II secretion system secretin GspD [Bradymonadia bacterium]
MTTSRTTPRLIALLGLLIGLLIPAMAGAQDEPPKLNTPRIPKQLDVPQINPGKLPTGRVNPKLKRKLGRDVVAQKKDDAAEAKAKPPPRRPRPRTRTPLPPRDTAGKAGARSRRDTKDKDDDKGADKDEKSSDLPKWRQQEENEEDKPEEPSLGADFVKACVKLPRGAKVSLDIYEEELEAVVKIIACMTGKNIIMAKSLKGKKITIYSPTLVTSGEAYRAFLTALEVNGYTISKQGKFLRIIESKDYLSSSDPIRKGGRPPNEDRMVTQLVALEHVDAQEVSQLLQQLATGSAKFIVYQPTNTLIVSEVASNLRKLLSLVDEIDVPSGSERLYVYQIVNADAEEIKNKIMEIYEQDEKKASGGGTTTNKNRRKRKRGKDKTPAKPTGTSVGESGADVNVSKIVADERTNRLFIITNEKSYRKVKDLIRRLDVAIPGDGQIHILQLKHAKAEELSSVLSNLSQNANRNSGGNRRSGRNNNSGRNNRSGNRSGNRNSGGGGAGGAALFEGEVQVTADADTNSLVITASLKDYLSIKSVVETLDKPRRQVFVEAVVMEVSLDNERQFGMSFHAPIPGTEVSDDSSPLLLGSFPSQEFNSLSLSPSLLSGFAATALGENIGGSSAFAELPSFGVVMRALASSGDVNILSTPHILTTDNQEAEIVVGQNVPFTTGFGGGLGALGGLGGLGGQNAAGGLGGLGGFGGFGFPQIQRQDVALTLKITPRINADNFVTMEIDQVIEELGPEPTPGLGPATTKRSVKTTAVVKDQQTVVIGGLQRTTQTNSDSKVPLLGEIPVLGILFRDSVRRSQKQNLLLLLTPYVVESSEDFKTIFKRKMEEHQEFVARFQQEGDVLAIGVDYRKKHGVLEAVNKSITLAREEERLLEDLRKQDIPPILPQDVDGIVLEADEQRLNPDVKKRMEELLKAQEERRRAIERGIDDTTPPPEEDVAPPPMDTTP